MRSPPFACLAVCVCAVRMRMRGSRGSDPVARPPAARRRSVSAGRVSAAWPPAFVPLAEWGVRGARFPSSVDGVSIDPKGPTCPKAPVTPGCS